MANKLGWTQGYEQLPSKSEEHYAHGEDAPTTMANRRSWSVKLQIILSLPLGLLCVFLGFMLGVGFERQQNTTLPAWARSIPRAEIGLESKTWEYSRIYGASPAHNNVTEPQWDELIPKGQGFVRYPPDAEHVSAVSAVHQLHCLYSIRRALFAEPGQPIAGINMEHMRPPHMRHCFDYLRQALMCSADSSLELYRTDLGGVTGWGFPRVCRSYDQLKAFAEQYRSNDREGFVEVITHPHPHHDGSGEE